MLDKQEKIFKALSDKNRIRIVKMLQKKSLCVCEIKDVLKLATSTVSKHLSILREAGLIVDWKDGKWINYKINPAPDSLVANALLYTQLQIEDDETIKNDRKLINCVDRNILCCN
ncbi:MAG: metalloregulator ArsR/SmtB family transcription factor [Ignavibacteriota bacterium]|nr:metalloregulator ArsR/SmtB family transcription factor [Ignavibacteriota bacterium]